MKIIVISLSEGVIQGCNFGTLRLFFNLGCSLRVLKPVKGEFEAKGLKALRQLRRRFAFMTTPDAAIGEPVWRRYVRC
jgi:hypothetical protein